MITIITLCTYRNRREKTISAFQSLVDQNVSGVNFIHCMVDDGSTDNTHEAIRSMFKNVQILRGNGSLYWAGGMRYGWKNLIKSKQYDYLLVYNDDIWLKPDAVSNLLCCAHELRQSNYPKLFTITGAFHDEKGELSYSGLRSKNQCSPLKLHRVHPDSKKCIDVCTINMNVCLIPKQTIDNVGFLSESFTHALADFEYGFRVRKRGGVNILAPKYIGICNRNQETNLYHACGFNLIKFLKINFSIKRGTFKEKLIYYFSAGGFFGAAVYVSYWIVFPVIFLVKNIRMGYDKS